MMDTYKMHVFPMLIEEYWFKLPYRELENVLIYMAASIRQIEFA